jgi:hypothetical protein
VPYITIAPIAWPDGKDALPGESDLPPQQGKVTVHQGWSWAAEAFLQNAVQQPTTEKRNPEERYRVKVPPISEESRSEQNDRPHHHARSQRGSQQGKCIQPGCLMPLEREQHCLVHLGDRVPGSPAGKRSKKDERQG